MQFPPVGWGEPTGTNPPAPQSQPAPGDTSPAPHALCPLLQQGLCHVALFFPSNPTGHACPQMMQETPKHPGTPARRNLSNKTLASMLKSKAGGLGWAAKILEGIHGEVKAATPCKAAGFGSPPEQGGSGATRGPSCGFGAGGGCCAVRRAFVHPGGRKRVFWSCL